MPGTSPMEPSRWWWLAADLRAWSWQEGSRVVVDERLEVPGHPNLHVVGDMAASLDPSGALLPQVAPVAMQGAQYVADKIRHRLHNEVVQPFTYVDRGSMATIGRHDAVAQLPGGIRLAGVPGWAAWLLLHLMMLIGFRNRASVLLNWAWNYFTYDRASRIIPDRPGGPDELRADPDGDPQ